MQIAALTSPPRASPAGASRTAPAQPVPAAPIEPGTPAHRMWRLDTPTRPDYLRSTDEMYMAMRELAAAHPTRAQLLDIGDSARKAAGHDDGHDIHALVLGERAADPAVPRILITAGVHPRETANPALLMEWAARTLDAAAAGDPARQALLATRTVVVVPMVNPDTHGVVTAGLETSDAAAIWKRTNLRDGGGVDLNRNFANRWGAGSATPGTRRYRGPAPASEPEVQAVQALGHALQPAAVYDLHSPGGVVLAPSGSADAQRAAALVARATGYLVSESDQYWENPVGGSTVKDWARDQLGATALTIETGAVHHQSDEQYADTRRRVLPALDALVATVDGAHTPPAAAAALAEPEPAPHFIPTDHLQGAVVEPWNDPADAVAAG